MTDLSHWDFVEQFRAKEAAELIVGIAPENDRLDNSGVRRMISGVQSTLFTEKITPVLRRMEQAYHGACVTLRNAVILSFDIGEGLQTFPAEPFDLHSDTMVEIRNLTRTMHASDTDFGDLYNVYFGRSEVQRWLGAIGMRSVYSFDRNQSDASVAPTGRWPWGNYHTELLGHLDAAAKHFWANYDPSDAKAMAPKNITVIDWLKTERNVSRQMAIAIATMLRPNGLRNGPRKK